MIAHHSSDRSSGGAFFGRRKGHRLRVRQSDLYATLLPRLALDLAEPAPPQLPSLFTHRPDNVRLEIGFGGGEHLVAEAKTFPQTGFIGCEPYINGMAKILSRVDAESIGNIRLFAGDALDLLAWVPAQSLARIDLIHPDPWPKRRHWKRRFVQPRTLAMMARALAPKGEFRFVSDIDDYCAWTLMHMAKVDNFIWTAQRADDWRKPWPGFTPTRYGQKAEREGRRASYLIFQKT